MTSFFFIMIQFIKNNLLWRDGKYITLFLILSLFFSFLFFKYLLILIIPFFLFCLYFFRNPERYFDVNNKNLIISPADGKVVEIDKNFNQAPLVLSLSKDAINKQLYQNNFVQKISIFLSPLDVHVNWLPTSGLIKKIQYRSGKFIVAFAPKSSEINERNDIIIENENGTILVRQIAGFIARRICCWIEENEKVQAGQKFGMIRFGSRVDILLPKNVEIFVKTGQKVRGGETILGRWL